MSTTNHPTILGEIHFLPDPFGIHDAVALISDSGTGQDRFFGGRLAGGELATVFGAHGRGPDELEIGYWVGADYFERGLAFEAGEAFVAALGIRFPDRRIIAECRRNNKASWHLLTKLGFAPTGEQGRRPGRERLMFRQRVFE